jgi:Uma2 family endonuclease
VTESGPYPSIRRLTVSEAILMVDVGIVRKDERVELLEGLLVETAPQGPLHSSATTSLGDRLRVVYAGRAMIREEKPLDAGRYSLPEPNIAVVRGQAGTYATRHPRGEDAILVVELAWTSQDQDRRKAAIYAAAAVPVYWLLDLAARKLEIRTSPQSGAYGTTQLLGEADVVSLPELAVQWPVRDLLP